MSTYKYGSRPASKTGWEIKEESILFKQLFRKLQLTVDSSGSGVAH